MTLAQKILYNNREAKIKILLERKQKLTLQAVEIDKKIENLLRLNALTLIQQPAQ